MRILLVEDEAGVVKMLGKALKEQKYSVDTAMDGEEALQLVKGTNFDLIILDIMLPKKNGLCVCADIRKQGKTTPIIMLTALGQVDNLVDGLNCGADDYIEKPFEMKELLARMRVLLRRNKAKKKLKITIADITFDASKRIFTKDDKKLELSFREFGILEYLFLHKGKTVSRKELLEHVWGNAEDMVFTNTVDVHIRYLRKKVGEDLIQTVRGFGYMVE